METICLIFYVVKILNGFLYFVDIAASVSKLWIPSLKLPLQLLSPPPPGAWGQQQWDNNDPSTEHCYTPAAFLA